MLSIFLCRSALGTPHSLSFSFHQNNLKLCRLLFDDRKKYIWFWIFDQAIFDHVIDTAGMSM